MILLHDDKPKLNTTKEYAKLALSYSFAHQILDYNSTSLRCVGCGMAKVSLIETMLP